MIEQERRRLRRLFGLALLTSAPAASLYACSDASAPSPADGGALADVVADVSVDDREEEPAEAAADVVLLPDTGCSSSFDFIDGGSDGDADAAPVEICNVHLPCGLPAEVGAVGCEIVARAPDGTLSVDAAIGCRAIDDAGCQGGVVPSGIPVTLLCSCDLFVGGGRRPAGLRPLRRVRAADALGAYLARMAHAETASVPAFETLARELRALGAPHELIAGAEEAARDEARHAEQMGRLARLHGAEPPRARVRRPPRPRSLEAIARENASHGCIEETYGALVACWQAQYARDARLRRAFACIAEDETRHAALSWAVHRWTNTQLDPRARQRTRRAQSRAVARLARRLETAPAASLIAGAGVPAPRHARALLAQLAKALV